jgi:Cof subfamily protein (haloacid dehalogenase superfamily)
MKNDKKRLYISDLDATLLDNSARLSNYTHQEIEGLLRKGVHFTIASARSVHSIMPIFQDLPLKLPVIEFNGAFISDLSSGRHLCVNSIEKHVSETVMDLCSRKNFSVIVSSFDGQRDNLYYSDLANEGERWYIENRIRQHDPRVRYCEDIAAPLQEEVICFTIIERLEKLEPEFEELRRISGIEVHLQENQYSPGWYWLTAHSAKASKDQAIQELQNMTGLDDAEVIVFGDNTNDIKMMQYADIAVAVENALPEVKSIADELCPSNTEDGVVKWIVSHETNRSGS